MKKLLKRMGAYPQWGRRIETPNFIGHVEVFTWTDRYELILSSDEGRIILIDKTEEKAYEPPPRLALAFVLSPEMGILWELLLERRGEPLRRLPLEFHQFETPTPPPVSETEEGATSPKKNRVTMRDLAEGYGLLVIERKGVCHTMPPHNMVVRRDRVYDYGESLGGHVDRLGFWEVESFVGSPYPFLRHVAKAIERGKTIERAIEYARKKRWEPPSQEEVAPSPQKIEEVREEETPRRTSPIERRYLS